MENEPPPPPPADLTEDELADELMDTIRAARAGKPYDRARLRAISLEEFSRRNSRGILPPKPNK